MRVFPKDDSHWHHIAWLFLNMNGIVQLEHLSSDATSVSGNIASHHHVWIHMQSGFWERSSVRQKICPGNRIETCYTFRNLLYVWLKRKCRKSFLSIAGPYITAYAQPHMQVKHLFFSANPDAVVYHELILIFYIVHVMLMPLVTTQQTATKRSRFCCLSTQQTRYVAEVAVFGCLSVIGVFQSAKFPEKCTWDTITHNLQVLLDASDSLRGKYWSPVVFQIDPLLPTFSS